MGNERPWCVIDIINGNNSWINNKTFPEELVVNTHFRKAPEISVKISKKSTLFSKNPNFFIKLKLMIAD